MMSMVNKDPIQLEDGLKELEKYLDSLVQQLEEHGRQAPNEYIKYYVLVYDMCTQSPPHNWSSDLYAYHSGYIERYLNGKVLPALKRKSGQGERELLEDIKHHWGKHKIMNRELKKIFCYLERGYTNTMAVPKVEEAGLQLFKTEICQRIKVDATSAILAVIEEDRRGMTAVDGDLVESVVKIMHEGYANDLEKPLLDATRSYFRSELEGWTSEQILNSEADDAMEHAIRKEEARSYLGDETRSKILGVIATAAAETAVAHAMLHETGEIDHGLIYQISAFF